MLRTTAQPSVASIRGLGLLAVLALLAALGGCAENQQTPPNSLIGDGSSGKYGRYGQGGANALAAAAGDLVYFASDSSELTPEGEQTLSQQARWLNQNGGQTVTIEGHADERGTREYNIALGARRAQTVRNRLVSLGVQPQRIRTISYGKERPVAVCDDITCWSQNRRAQTVLNAGIASR